MKDDFSMKSGLGKKIYNFTTQSFICEYTCIGNKYSNVDNYQS